MRSLFCLVAAASAVACAPAIGADCTASQLHASAASIIEPCTKRLDQSGLSEQEKAQTHFLRGRGYHRTRRFGQARADYEEAFRLDPRDAEILVSWANLDFREQHASDGIARLEQAYALSPTNAHVLRALGTVAADAGDTGTAFEFYTRALRSDPTEPYALYFRAQVYRNRHEFKEAIADADALVAIPRQIIEIFLDQAGEIRDFHAIALALRGEILDAAGQSDAAARDFDAAVAVERTAQTLIARGRYLRRMPERRSEALADLEAAVALEPRSYDAQFGLGMVLIALKRYEDALHAFDVAVAAAPTGSALIMRARMSRQLGHTEDAVRDYMTAFLIDPRQRQYAINAIRAAGYWASEEIPREITPALHDALRACMIDIKCN